MQQCCDQFHAHPFAEGQFAHRLRNQTFDFQQFRQFVARGLADPFQGLSALAQQDAPLAVAFDVDALFDAQRAVPALLEGRRLDARGVGQLLVDTQVDFFDPNRDTIYAQLEYAKDKDKVEWISYTGFKDKQFTGVKRGLLGTKDIDHAAGTYVYIPPQIYGCKRGQFDRVWSL